MEVKIKEQDEDSTFSNTDTNGKIIHIFSPLKAKGSIHDLNVNCMNQLEHEVENELSRLAVIPAN